MQSTAQPTQATLSNAGVIWLKLAMLYLIVGIVLGMAMGAKQDFTLRSVHTHLNLLGWATMALAGLIYSVFPQAGQSRLARVHFWLHNIALPLMLGSLAFVLLGHMQLVPVLAVGEFCAALGILAFAANIYLNLKKG